jgi:hypothetical protein
MAIFQYTVPCASSTRTNKLFESVASHHFQIIKSKRRAAGPSAPPRLVVLILDKLKKPTPRAGAVGPAARLLDLI